MIVVSSICTFILTVATTFFLMRESNLKSHRALREATRNNLKQQKALTTIVATHNTLVTQVAAADKALSHLQQELAALRMNNPRR
jgi:hypothetical protein